MSDLSEYISDKERIKELEKRVVLLISDKSKWKRKFETLKSKNPPLRKNRTNKAKVLVIAYLDGDRSLSFREMAKMCFLSIETIKNISYKLRHSV